MYELNSTSGLMRIFCTLVNFLLKSLIYWLITLRKYLFLKSKQANQTQRCIPCMEFLHTMQTSSLLQYTLKQLFLENRNHIAFVVYEKH